LFKQNRGGYGVDKGEGTCLIFVVFGGHQPGDPAKAAEAVIDIMKGQGVASGKSLPISVALGTDCYEVVKSSSNAALSRLEEWEEWKELTISTDFQPRSCRNLPTLNLWQTCGSSVRPLRKFCLWTLYMLEIQVRTALAYLELEEWKGISSITDLHKLRKRTTYRAC